jgi:hypothetical protein
MMSNNRFMFLWDSLRRVTLQTTDCMKAHSLAYFASV